jgi:predicted DNA-binding transcriptional regulator AlpA
MVLSFNTTATRLCVSRKTLYKMIERKEITPAFTLELGKQKRAYFHEHEVMQLVQSRNLDKAPLAASAI